MARRVATLRWGLSTPGAVTLAIAAASWWLSAGRMRGMDAGPGAALGPFAWFVATWLLMMAAMMLPVIAPRLPVKRFAANTGQAASRPAGVAALFVAGYLVVWACFGVAAYVVLRAGGALAGGAFAWHHAGKWLAAAVLAAAAAYQWTSTKRLCLERCRVSLGRPGGGSLSGAADGVQAGLRCVASSWALMAVLFALGFMSLTWMALVAVLIAAERLLPTASPARVAAAAVLLALALGVALAPGSVPGLVVPGTAAAHRAMARMPGMEMQRQGGDARDSMSMSR